MIVGYCRLSRDDNKQNYSSIEEQKNIIQSYALSSGWIIENYYIDDNMSGYKVDEDDDTLFDRPQFQKMWGDIKEGKITCVLLKDLSRLGRNNPVTLLAVERLRKLDCKLILCDEGKDIVTNQDDTLPIKTWFNEMYVKDISRKVRANMLSKQSKGKLVMGNYYGYIKKDKTDLIVDEEIRPCIELIYNLYIEGNGYIKISDYLNINSCFPTPSVYYAQKHQERGRVYGHKVTKKWQGYMVKNILSNDVYCGNLRTHKKQTKSIRGQVKKLPENEHFIFPNHHEGIIDNERWNLVQEIRKNRDKNEYKGRKCMSKRLLKISLTILLFISLLILSACGGSGSGTNKETNQQSDSTQQKDAESSVSQVESNQQKINSGLLLGLRDDYDDGEGNSGSNYRTLWIAQTDGKIGSVEKSGSIVTPYGSDFWTIELDKFTASKPRDINSNSTWCEYKYDIGHFIAYKTNIKDIPEYTVEKVRSIYNDEWTYRTINPQLTYVGNQYVCIKEENMFSGGGSFGATVNTYKLFDISALNDGIDSKMYLDLFDKDEAFDNSINGFHEKYDKVISEEKRPDGNLSSRTEQFVDEKNIALQRNKGSWEAVLPLFTRNQNFRNGSFRIITKELIPLALQLPKSIKAYDELCIDWNTIKKAVPEATDAISSPTKDMLAVFTPENLLVYANPLAGITKPVLTVKLNKNESMIMAQWATGEYIDKWTQEVSKYLK